MNSHRKKINEQVEARFDDLLDLTGIKADMIIATHLPGRYQNPDAQYMKWHDDLLKFVQDFCYEMTSQVEIIEWKG